MPNARARQSIGLLGVAALVLVLLGAGCQNPFRKKPADVLQKAHERFVDVESARFNVQAAFTFDAPGKDGSRERGSFSFTASGVGDDNRPEDSRSDGTFSMTFDAPPASGSIVLENRSIGQVMYLRLKDVTLTPKGQASGAPSQMEIDAMIGAAKGIIGGKWVKIDPKELQELAAQFGGTTAPAGMTKTPEQIRALNEEVLAAFRANPVFVSRADLGSAKVGGEKMYHYRVGVNRTALLALFDRLAPSFATFEATPEKVAMVRAALQEPKVMEFIDGANVEVWISKKEFDFRKIVIPVDVTEDDVTVSGNITIDLSDWGKPVAVEEPTDAKTIQELLGGFLGGMGAGGLTPSASGSLAPSADGAFEPAGLPPATRGTGAPEGTESDADNDGLSDAMEQFYGSNPSKPDTDGDGFTDGDEVNKGYNPTGPGKLFGVNLDGE